MGVSFGCTVGTGYVPAYGVANSQGSSATAEIAQCRGATGAATNEVAYSRTVKRNCTAVFTGSLPTAGSKATLFGVEALVESAAVTETNTGYAMAECTTTKGDNSTQVAI